MSVNSFLIIRLRTFQGLSIFASVTRHNGLRVFLFSVFFLPFFFHVYSKVISEIAVTNRTLMSHFLPNESVLYLFIFVTFRHKNFAKDTKKVLRNKKKRWIKGGKSCQILLFVEEKSSYGRFLSGSFWKSRQVVGAITCFSSLMWHKYMCSRVFYMVP